MNLPLAGIKDKRTMVQIGDVTFGSQEIIIMAGPCAVESSEQIRAAAKVVRSAGGKVLRGGIFKPRTSPYSFQGLGNEGLEYLVSAAREQGLLSVTEVVDAESLEFVSGKVDIIQIGARNMQNFQLLKLAGEIRQPIILKRGMAATIEEWLLAAEYILSAGNNRVILCERGIRTFETSTRNTLDLSAIGVAKSLSHLPVIVDPSHAAGRIDLIPALAKAAISAGADGLLVEMHPNPAEAKCDGPQSLSPAQFTLLAQELSKVAEAVSRTIVAPVEASGSIGSLRQQIDGIDRQLVELLAARMAIVRKVAGQKSFDKVRDVAREQEIIQRVLRQAQEQGCPAELIKEIYALIFNQGVQTQLKSKLARDIDHNFG